MTGGTLPCEPMRQAIQLASALESHPSRPQPGATRIPTTPGRGGHGSAGSAPGVVGGAAVLQWGRAPWGDGTRPARSQGGQGKSVVGS